MQKIVPMLVRMLEQFNVLYCHIDFVYFCINKSSYIYIYILLISDSANVTCSVKYFIRVSINTSQQYADSCLVVNENEYA